jgi:SnoaL-like protein
MTLEDTRATVRAYHDAYRRRDLPAIASVLGDQFRFSSPMMAFDTPQQHMAALARFVPFVTNCEMINELYADGEATLVYDLHVSLPPRVQRTAEHFKVHDGRIAEIMIIFDATPWHPIIEAAAHMRGPLGVASAHHDTR